jgi:butyrate kinase
MRVIEKYINGEPLPDGHNLDTDKVTPEQAAEIRDAMCHQVAKEIGAYASSMSGEVDGIVLTGGVMHDDYCKERIKKQVKWIAPVFVYPGGDELGALRDAGERALTGKEVPMEYKSLSN